MNCFNCGKPVDPFDCRAIRGFKKQGCGECIVKLFGFDRSKYIKPKGNLEPIHESQEKAP